MFSEERIIILRIENPNVPSIDLIDMPGLVSAPQSSKTRSMNILRKHIEDYNNFSIYLCILKASDQPNTTMAMPNG